MTPIEAIAYARALLQLAEDALREGRETLLHSDLDAFSKNSKEALQALDVAITEKKATQHTPA